MDEKILLGNEAIAYGILAGGASVVTSYPGTPASEILGTVMNLVKDNGLQVHAEWSINEKTAVEIAFSNAIANRRSAVAMKQVGLNVSADPVMSIAYMGVAGGLVIIVADDPGPQSSQTEQDSRFFAMWAKIPILDPSSPEEALRMTLAAFELSEKYKTPVMVRPTTRVCHARQTLALPEITPDTRPVHFDKDPYRWAATPGPRLKLHHELNEKIRVIKRDPIAGPNLIEGRDSSDQAIVASGIAFAYLKDLKRSKPEWQNFCLYKVDMPYPIDPEALLRISSTHKKVLVVEETEPVIEYQFPCRENVSGRIDGAIPNAGELTPDILSPVVDSFLEQEPHRDKIPVREQRRPSLCAGCAHRAAFYSIKKALPKGIYASDIGCYTLGLNLGTVDTCLCMGAAISQASGFFQAFKHEASPPPVIAVIGDSTFFHAGIPPTVNAIVTGARFVLVVLDNATTAMTGRQPTPGTGSVASDFDQRHVSLEQIIAGCGVQTIITRDPYDVPGFIKTVKDAHKRTASEGVVAIIARHPCIQDRAVRGGQQMFAMSITDECNACGYCIKEFECPALEMGEDTVVLDRTICSGCGVCVHVCPRGAIEAKEI